MNLEKFTKDGFQIIRTLPILTIYRNSLKLMKTYPSIKRKELRESLILGINKIYFFKKIFFYHRLITFEKLNFFSYLKAKLFRTLILKFFENL